MKNIFRKRTPLFLCTLFLCIFLPAILLCSHCFDRALFHKITSAYVQSSLEHDALSLHFVMAYPNLQGIHLKDAALPVYSKEGFCRLPAEIFIRALLSRFEKIK